MATASEEFLVRFRYWLVSGGMITRNACGRMILRIVSLGRSPSAPAASVCPFPTERIPARTISEMNAPV